MLVDHPRILDGSRSWEAAQRAFQGHPDARYARFGVACGWHAPPTSPFEGSFALARAGGPMADLAGRVVQLRADAREPVFLYVIEAVTGLPFDLSLYRYAYLKIHALSDPGVVVDVYPVPER